MGVASALCWYAGERAGHGGHCLKQLAAAGTVVVQRLYDVDRMALVKLHASAS